MTQDKDKDADEIMEVEILPSTSGCNSKNKEQSNKSCDLPW